MLHIRIKTHFHGGVPHIGDLADDDDDLAVVGAADEPQIVYGGGDHVAVGVPHGHRACGLVEPLHEGAAEEPAGSVQMVRAHHVDDLGP